MHELVRENASNHANRTIACNGAGGRVGFEIKAYRAGPLMRNVLSLSVRLSMIVYGFDSIASMLEQDGYLFKMLANDSGVVLFPHTTEHRDATQPGIKYADDSGGNALAALVKPGRIEFRYHRQFTDERVKKLTERILTLPELEFAYSFTVAYQARILILGTDRISGNNTNRSS